MNPEPDYAARLEIDYPEQRDRLTTFFRLLWIIPIAIILGLIARAGETVTYRMYPRNYSSLQCVMYDA